MSNLTKSENESILISRAIKTLKFFIENADLSLESSFDLIFADSFEDDDYEDLFQLTYHLDGFKRLDDCEIITKEEFEEILSDLEDLL